MAEKLPVAFLAGLLSVITPCVLPLVPGYLSAVSAVEVDRLGERGAGRRVVAASLPFIAGFTVVFVALGAGAAAIASVVAKTTQTEIAGFALVVIGLAFIGAAAAGRSGRSRPGCCSARTGGGSAALLGGAFAVCAAPCIGTVLASILVLASSSGDVARGVVLLLAYSLGLGAAFVLAGVAFAHAMRAFRWVRSHYDALRVAVRRRPSSRSGCCSSSTATGGCASRSTSCSRRSGSARSSAASSRATSRPRWTGAYGPSRRSAFCRCRSAPIAPAAARLVGEDDGVDEPLEEVALVRAGVAPRRLERLVRRELLAGACEPKPALVFVVDGVIVALQAWRRSCSWGRPLPAREARGAAP